MGIETAILAAATTAGGTALPWLSTAGSLSSIAAAGGTAGSIASLAGGASSIFSGISGISSLFGGLQGLMAGNQQSDFASQQALLAAAENDRISQREARFEAENLDKTIRRQKLAYMKSGVTLEGSPLLVMEETRRKGQDNIDEILRAGEAGSSAMLLEGRMKSKQLKATGRSSFISGITNAGQSFSSLFEAA